MEIADTPKMELAAQKISVVDHINGFQYTPERPDNFVIDMEDFSSSTISSSKESYANSRVTLQRSFSRKGSVRGGSEKKSINSNGSQSKEKDSAVAGSSPRETSSAVAAAALAGGGTPEKGTVATVDHSGNSNGQGHHQITITSAASNIKATSVDGRCNSRRNSFKRSQTSWLLDPRKVLFFFATLSSIGTLLLICFTLSIAGVQSDDAAILE
ncbi:hypothetical protein LINPERHAP2_LOCUS26403 [Linum perenne]